jgi:hypothetical protein
MKLVLFQTAEQHEPVPGLLTERGVVNIAGVIENLPTPQLTMQGVIEAFDRLRPALDRQAVQGEALSLSSVRLRAPCRGRAKSSAASPITGSTRNARHGRSTCF